MKKEKIHVETIDERLYTEYKEENSGIEYSKWLELTYPKYYNSIIGQITMLGNLTLRNGHSKELDTQKNRWYFKLHL